jgi:hypothetical protein
MSSAAFIRIKRVPPVGVRAYEDETFAPLMIDGVADVGFLAARACELFGWGAPTRALLFLVAATGRAPLPAELDAALLGAPLSPFDTLALAGVVSGSCLVARVPPPAPAAPLASMGSTIVDAIVASFARLEASLPARIAQLLSGDAGTTVLSDAEYEDDARIKLPAILLERCGLEIVRGADTSRSELEGLEWDFCAPVLVASTAPHPNAVPGVFEVFPRRACYERPAAVAARHVTPTKFAAAPDPPAAHYLVIFEATVARKWTHRSSAREGLLERLEARLALSLERAFSHSLCERNVLDLVAADGVVAPAPYSESVRERMGRPDAPPLLRQMMDASRFVFIGLPKARAAA